jgi:hypothetical protein
MEYWLFVLLLLTEWLLTRRILIDGLQHSAVLCDKGLSILRLIGRKYEARIIVCDCDVLRQDCVATATAHVLGQTLFELHLESFTFTVIGVNE